MEQFLKNYLLEKINKEHYYFSYSEDKNEDVLTNKWLGNRTSYIYKVGVLVAVDNNKCDFAHIVIGSQRGDKSEPEIKGSFYFSRGENDDMGATIKRAFELLKLTHPIFEEI